MYEEQMKAMVAWLRRNMEETKKLCRGVEK